MQKKIVKKYAELMHQAQQATGRKEAVGLIHKAAKLKTKFDNYEMMWSSTKQFSQIRMSFLNKFSIKDIILSSKEAYQKELKNNGVGSQIGRSLFNKFSIKDIILSSKEAYQKELKNNGVGSQIGKSLFNKFSIKDIILSSKEAYQKELKNNGVGSQIGKSLFNKFSIKDFSFNISNR